MDRIRSAYVDGPSSVVVREEYATDAGPGEVVVDVSLCGICGTDTSHYRSGASRPAIFGHEWVGIVRAVGDRVRSLEPGDRVIQAVPAPCGECAYCDAGLAEECQTVIDVASGKGPSPASRGGFSRSVVVAADRLLQVPDTLPDEAAALVEPAAVVTHALLRCPPRPGGTVVVQGAGPIGVLAGQVARILGAATIVVVEPAEERRELALRLGADVALSPVEVSSGALQSHLGELGADLAIECTGVPALFDTAAGFVRRGGSLLSLGYPHSPSEVEVGGWMRKQLSISTSIAYQRRDFVVAMEYIAQGRIDVLPLHTGTVSLDDLDRVMREMADGASAHVKALVDPRR